MRRAGLIVAGSLVALTVTACGSDSSSSPASSSESSRSAAPTTSAEASVTTSASSTSATSSPATSGAGPAPAGSQIKAGASSALPSAVGPFTKQAGSGPATIYSADGKLISVSFLAGSKYDNIVTAITAQPMSAGTGKCGTTSSADNITCYLKAADGVYNISADAGEAPLPTVVSFANVLTATVGTG